MKVIFLNKPPPCIPATHCCVSLPLHFCVVNMGSGYTWSGIMEIRTKVLQINNIDAFAPQLATPLCFCSVSAKFLRNLCHLLLHFLPLLIWSEWSWVTSRCHSWCEGTEYVSRVLHHAWRCRFDQWLHAQSRWLNIVKTLNEQPLFSSHKGITLIIGMKSAHNSCRLDC